MISDLGTAVLNSKSLVPGTLKFFSDENKHKFGKDTLRVLNFVEYKFPKKNGSTEPKMAFVYCQNKGYVILVNDTIVTMGQYVSTHGYKILIKVDPVMTKEYNKSPFKSYEEAIKFVGKLVTTKSFLKEFYPNKESTSNFDPNEVILNYREE